MSSSPVFAEWSGQDLIDEVNNQLLGYAGSVPVDTILSYLNNAKDEVWLALKENNQKYFETSSQYSDSTKLNYFPPIVSGTREYALPEDFREIEFIECMTVGYEDVRFVFRPQQHPDFQAARRASTADKGNPQTPFTFHYDIVGNATMTIAEYTGTTLDLVLWYVRALADIDPDHTIDGVLMPYARMLATYATKRCTLSLQDLPLFDRWKEEWKEKLLGITAGSGPRNQADPEFAIDFEGA